MAISIKGKLAEKAQQLLGGKNITEKRVESLLDEVERLRQDNEAMKAAMHLAPPTMPPAPPPAVIEVTPSTPFQVQPSPFVPIDPVKAAVLEQIRNARPGEMIELPNGMTLKDLQDVPTQPQPAPQPPQLVPDPEPDEDDWVEPATPVPSSVPLPPAAVGAPDVGQLMAAPPGLSVAERFILDQLASLSREIKAVKAGQTEGTERDRAVMESKLPTPEAVKPPVAGPYKTYADIPRGRYVKSPFGPPVKIQKCACGRCSDAKELHYFCSVCGGGAYDLLGVSRPYHIQGAYGPGGTWGVNHYACSEPCFMRYIAMAGMRAGVPVPLANDFQPNRPASVLSD
jgi:hypothetical protein